MTLTPYYEQQIKKVHRDNVQKPWGTTGARNFGDYVVRFLEQRRAYISTVLDFGAGQRSLEKYVKERAIDIHVKWTNYDPGIDGIDRLPEGERFDAVISSDVLEHVEPEEVDNTIIQLGSLAKKAQFHHIACDPSVGKLPDGRDQHLVTENLEWWLKKFEDPKWVVMYQAQCAVRKRGKLKNHCHIQIDRI